MKQTLREYLQTARDAIVWKLDGLSEYDVRRPVVPTGTNLLGLVKHLTCVELGYFGPVFGRPMAQPNPWFDDSADTTPTCSSCGGVARGHRRQLSPGLRRRRCDHRALNLDSPGVVPWWGNQPVTLYQCSST